MPQAAEVFSAVIKPVELGVPSHLLSHARNFVQLGSDRAEVNRPDIYRRQLCERGNDYRARDIPDPTNYQDAIARVLSPQNEQPVGTGARVGPYGGEISLDTSERAAGNRVDHQPEDHTLL